MKKVLALVLAVVLAVGMSSVAFAADKDLLSRTMWLGFSSTRAWNANGSVGTALEAAVTDPSLNLNNITATSSEFKVRFDLKSVLANATYADSKAGTNPVFAGDLTKSAFSGDDFGVGYKIKKGGTSVLKNVDTNFDNGNAQVRVCFQKYISVTGSLDWEVEFWLTNNRRKIDGSEVTVSGTFDRSVAAQDLLGAETDFWVADKNKIIKADEYIKGIEIELCEDLSLFTRLFEGKKYFAFAHSDVNDADFALMGKYPEIENVYHTVTSGISTSDNILQFTMSDNLYAYTTDADGNLKYVGRTRDRLPYNANYYLSAKEIKVASAADDTIDEAPVASGSTNNASTGPKDDYVNVNYNASTGR